MVLQVESCFVYMTKIQLVIIGCKGGGVRSSWVVSKI